MRYIAINNMMSLKTAVSHLDYPKNRPRVCFVGAMLGRNPGYATTQGEVVRDGLIAAGYSTVTVSTLVNRYARLIDVVITLLKKGRNIDIQCLQVYGGASFILEDVASSLGRLFGQRIIMSLHGGALPEFIARYPGWSARVLSRADAIVTPSPFLAKAVAQIGINARVIPNVLNPTAYPFRLRKSLAPRMFWMRSFHPIYNPKMAVEVLDRVRKIIPNATLVMGGQDKGEMSAIQSLVNKMDLDGAVRFPGYLNMSNKLREGDAADIFLNTNHVDNTPVSVIEACAMGLPVVSTAVGGIPDLLTNNETAMLVPDNDAEAMAAGVMRLMGEPELASRLSTNGPKLAEQFSWEKVSPKWEALFAEVLLKSTKKNEVLD